VVAGGPEGAAASPDPGRAAAVEASGPASPDTGRLQRTLGDPALGRVVARLRRRLELGRPLEADLTLADATEAERVAVGRLLGRPAPLRGRSLRVPVGQLAAALTRAGIAPDLRSAVEAIAGPVTPRPEVRAAEAAERERVLGVLAASRHSGASWYEQWLATLQADGTLTRLIRGAAAGAGRLVGDAVAVLGELPADTLPLPVLAERATADTKALAGTRLARLVLRALALREAALGGEPIAAADLSRAEIQRMLWESAGAIPDDLASQVLVLGLTATGAGPLAGWLCEAAAAAVPFRLTLQQLVAMPVVPAVARVFVCENPSVLRAAASARACADGTALVCTEGVASAACHRLAGAVAAAGAEISWRGDFDWTGLRAVTAAVGRYGARPWRMGLADYEEELGRGETERLKGPAASSSWDAGLAARMEQSGRAVMEERLIPLLLGDLGVIA
jgi:uncharacterized protein (TIGR02679 family)